MLPATSRRPVRALLAPRRSLRSRSAAPLHRLLGHARHGLRGPQAAHASWRSPPTSLVEVRPRPHGRARDSAGMSSPRGAQSAIALVEQTAQTEPLSRRRRCAATSPRDRRRGTTSPHDAARAICDPPSARHRVRAGCRRRALDRRARRGRTARASARTSRTSPSAPCVPWASRRATFSGYLHPKPDAEIGETVAGESHAWVEWFDGSWRGYDPTNAIEIGDRHVIVGRGRDYTDVPPLRGVYAGPRLGALRDGRDHPRGVGASERPVRVARCATLGAVRQNTPAQCAQTDARAGWSEPRGRAVQARRGGSRPAFDHMIRHR